MKKEEGGDRRKGHGGKHYCSYLLVLQIKYSSVLSRLILFYGNGHDQNFDYHPSLAHVCWAVHVGSQRNHGY